jgi:predicted membrane protein
MRSCERTGAWVVPSRIEARATLGSIQLDLREAELGPDTTIDADVLMGSLEILVPHGVDIDVDVELLAGKFNDVRERRDRTTAAARRLRVVGRAWFSSCEITRAA